MLVLSRKLGEVVVIGVDIRVTVVGIQGNSVRLGFDGPREVPVHREEIHRQIVGAERREGTSLPVAMS